MPANMMIFSHVVVWALTRSEEEKEEEEGCGRWWCRWGAGEGTGLMLEFLYASKVDVCRYKIYQNMFFLFQNVIETRKCVAQQTPPPGS